ncbi:MAG: HAD hydrolase-like protein [Brevinematales bacterium]|nr:HAD hydrolase-like protein [Brevinematales bacterium]
METTKLYIIMEIDNVIYDFGNYYLKTVDYIGSFVNENFGLNKDEFLTFFIKKLTTKTFINNDYLFITYEVLKEHLKKQITFSSNNSKVSFINTLRMKFNQGRLKNLKFLNGALTLLKKLKDMGIIIIGFTNSPSRVTKQRIKLLDIDRYFDTIYALQDNFLNQNENNEDFEDTSVASIWYQAICNNVSSLICDIMEFPPTYQKPSKRGLQRIIEEEKIPTTNLIVFGNSVENDILPAKMLNLKTILFNTKIKIQNRNIISKFLKEMNAKSLRKILNLPKNEKLLKQIDKLITVTSLSDLLYFVENIRVKT